MHHSSFLYFESVCKLLVMLSTTSCGLVRFFSVLLITVANIANGFVFPSISKPLCTLQRAKAVITLWIALFRKELTSTSNIRMGYDNLYNYVPGNVMSRTNSSTRLRDRVEIVREFYREAGAVL